MVLVGKINLQENVKEYMLNVHNIAIESEYEDDGLYMITIWFTDDQIGYIAISRDLQGSCPEKIYFEWGDQSNGRFIEEFSYSFDNLILKLDLNDPSFRLCCINRFETESPQTPDVVMPRPPFGACPAR